MTDVSAPTAATKLARVQLRAALRRTGRESSLNTRVGELRFILREEHLHHLPLVEAALGKSGQAAGGRSVLDVAE